jgi:hypothetical protein
MNAFSMVFNRNGFDVCFATQSEKVAIRFVDIGWYILILWLGM